MLSEGGRRRLEVKGRYMFYVDTSTELSCSGFLCSQNAASVITFSSVNENDLQTWAHCRSPAISQGRVEMNETRLCNQTEWEMDEGWECLLQDTNVLEEGAGEISCPLLFFRSLAPTNTPHPAPPPFPRDLSAACIMHSQK